MPPRKRKTNLENSDEQQASGSRGKNSSNSGKGRKEKADNKPGTSKESSVKKPSSELRNPLSNIPLNIVKNLNLYQSNACKNNLYKSCEAILSQRLRNFMEHQTLGAFCNRVTSLDWHRSRIMFIVGLKTGDLCLHTRCEHRFFSESHVWHGCGPGLSILDVHFPEHMEDKMVTASIDGTVKVWDIGQITDEPLQVVMETGTIQRWFCSVSSSRIKGITVVGDTKGALFLHDKDMKQISKHNIHKGKVNTAEISTVDGVTLATASLDKSVKIFDLRLMKEPLFERTHACGVSSAYFSKTNSCRLLTTDYYDQISVFSGVNWDLESSFEHPHRQYMYLTPIRATWHPQCDLIVVGRYPDPKKQDICNTSTVDIFDVRGDMKCQLNPGKSSIVTLTSFNSSGEFLLSAQGMDVSLWKYNDPSDLIKDPLPGSDGSDNDDDNSRKPPPKKKPKASKPPKKSSKTASV